ncbi:hypothetical protein ACPA54_15155 [Uniformispora flossi]|uniref:hypothetical protein n=1 Tax=Uniformispora flossi TaxID=3390723 RepID=UPI003C2E0652
MKKRLFGITRTAWAIALSFAAIATSSGSAGAAPVTDNMFPTLNYGWPCQDGVIGGTICQTDNRDLTGAIDQQADPIIGYTGFLAAIQDLNDNSVLDFTGELPVYEGDAETDIIFQTGPLDEGVAGQTWCDDAVTPLKCDQHYVRFNTNYPSQYLTCHEMGHAVGLMHGPEAYPALDINDARLACMNYTWNDQWYGYSNIDIINATY